MDLNERSILQRCPHLDELSICGGMGDVQLDFRNFRPDPRGIRRIWTRPQLAADPLIHSPQLNYFINDWELMCSDLYYTESHTFIAIVLIPDRSVRWSQ